MSKTFTSFNQLIKDLTNNKMPQEVQEKFNDFNSNMLVDSKNMQDMMSEIKLSLEHQNVMVKQLQAQFKEKDTQINEKIQNLEQVLANDSDMNESMISSQVSESNMIQLFNKNKKKEDREIKIEDESD